MQNVNTSAKLAGFVVGIALVFFAAYFIGTAVGPMGEQPVQTHEHAQTSEQ